MAKWAIYDRDGNVRHESVTEYNGDGKIVYQDTFEYSGNWMGECFLTVSVKAAYPIDFQIGDYIEYRGEKFTINYDPTVIKKSRRGTYGEGFTYDSIKFNSLSDELTQMRLHDWVLSDNTLHYTSLPTFSFYAKDVDDLVDRLQACADRWCKDNNRAKGEYWMFYTLKNNTTGTADTGQTQTVYERTTARARDVMECCGVEEGTEEYASYLNEVADNWKAAYGIDGSYKDSRDDERYDRNISITGQSVWDAMAMIKQQFGLNFIIRGRNVYVGTAGVPTSHIFKYGKGNGLYEVDKTADQDQLVVTRLHAYGGSDNLPTRYYASLNVVTFAKIEKITSNNKETNLYSDFDLDLDFAARYFNVPLQGYGDGNYVVRLTADGITVNARAYQKLDSARISIYTEYLSGSTDADDNTDEENFRKFQDALAEGKTVYFASGVKRDSFPADHLTASTQNLPDNMAVNSLMLPGFPNNALADICRAEYDSEKDVTNYYITNPDTKTETLFHTESGKHVVVFSKDKYDPFIVSPNAEELGIRDGDINCTEENDDNGLEKVYPTIEEVTDTQAGIGNTGKRLDAVVGAERVDDNGVYPKSTTDESKIKGFHIYLPALGFDLRQAAKDAGGSDAQISMKDGFCGARTFPVASITAVSDTSAIKQTYPDAAWDLNCRRAHDDSLDLYFPYSYAKSVSGVSEAMTDAYQVRKGDHYVLTGIEVSDVNYVWTASVKLLAKAIHWLCKNDYTRYVYSPKIDEIYMAREAREAAKSNRESLHDTLKEGDILLFQDSDLRLNGSVYIDKLTIKENGNNGIPTYEVTLRDEVTVGTLQRIQNKVDSIATDVKSGNVGGGLMSTSQVATLIEAFGAEWFISKLQDDTAQGLITLLKGLLVGDGTHGIDEKGKATLLSVFGSAVDASGNTVWYITEEGKAKLATLIADTIQANGQLIADNIHSKNYADTGDGSGTGFNLWVDGNISNMVLDNLTVRGKWTAAVLEILKLQYTAGNLTLTAAGGEIYHVEAYAADDSLATGIDTDADANKLNSVRYYRCYFKATDGDRHIDNLWHVGDLVRCQTFNLKDGTYRNAANRMYYRVVVNVGKEVKTINGVECFYIDLSNSEMVTVDGVETYGLMHNKTNANVPVWLTNDAPQEGDAVAHVGSATDTDRQGAVQLVAVGDEAVRIYSGINETLESLNQFVTINLAPKGSYINTRFFKFTNGWKENNPTIQCGDWTAGTVAYGSEVYQHNGSSWLCVAEETTDEPSEGSADWKQIAQKGDDGAASYDVALSRYQGMLTVDDLGNVIGGLYTTSTIDGKTVKQFRVSTAVFVRKGQDILLEQDDDEPTKEGHYKLQVISDDCACMVKNSTVYIEKIKNLRDGVAETDEEITDYDAMRQMSFCRVNIVVDCEGKAARTIEFPIRIAHDAQPFMVCDLSNEHASIGWNTKAQKYYGLPVETEVSLMYKNQLWPISTMEVTGVPSGLKATITENGSKRKLSIGLDGTINGDFVDKVLNINLHITGIYAGATYEYDKTLTIDKSNDVAVFEIVTNVDNVMVGSDGTLSASTVTAEVYATSADNNRYKVDTLQGMKLQYALDSLTAWQDYTAGVGVTADNLYVAFRLVDDSEAIVYDRETVPVVKQGKDGTSFSVNGTAVGYFEGGDIDIKTPAAYFSSIGYTPKSGDLCLYLPVMGNASIYKYNGSTWADRGETIADNECWLIDNDKDTKDGHIFVYVKSGSAYTWKDMGNLKGPAGNNGSDAEYYELSSEPGTFHQYTGGKWNDSVTVRLWHVKGASRTEVKGQSVVLIANVNDEGTESTEVMGMETLPATISAEGTYGSWFDDEQHPLLSITVRDNNTGAADLIIPAVRDGNNGVGYFITPQAFVVTEGTDESLQADDDTADDYRYKTTNFIYTGIPDVLAIHKSVGSVDTIVAADSISVDSDGETLLADNWLSTLKASFKTGTGYSLTGVMTSSSLRSDTTVNKIKFTFVADGVTLRCEVYINRLGTTSTTVVGDTTTMVMNRVETKLQDYPTTTEYQAWVKANSLSLESVYTKEQVDEKDRSVIQQTAETISLRTQQLRGGRSMWINGDFEISESLAPKYIHNATDTSKTETDSLVADDVPAGFNKALKFSCQSAYSGVFWRKDTQKYVEPVNGKAYCLSFFAKATTGCNMTVGFEGISVGTVALTSEWRRFAVYFGTSLDYSRWNNGTGAVVFYPSSALGDNYVLLTGIQFETGTEAAGAPTVFSNSTYDWTITGIDIRNGIIDAIAGIFNFVGKDGKAYIKVEQDDGGYPHLVFYDPNTKDSDGNPVAAYDLGYGGLSQLVQTSQQQGWRTVIYYGTYAEGSTIHAEDLYEAPPLMSTAFEYKAAWFKNYQGEKQYPSTEAKNADLCVYLSDDVDSNYLPTSTVKLEDGWHLLYYKREYSQKGGETQVMPDGSELRPLQSSIDTVYYTIFLTKDGRRVYKDGELLTHELAVARYTGISTVWGDYTIYLDGALYVDSTGITDGSRTVLPTE